MQNILICIATNKFFNSEYIKRLCNEINDDVRCYVVVGYWWEEGQYNNDCFCFSRDDCIKGKFQKYEAQLELKRGFFLDSEQIDECGKFLYESLMIQRRFEYKYPYFLSDKLKSHTQLAIEQIDFWNSFIEQYNINRIILTDVPHDNYEYTIYKLGEIKIIDTYIIKNVFKTNNYFLLNNYRDINQLIKKEDYCSLPIEDVKMDDDFNLLFESIKNSINTNHVYFKNETSRKKEFNSRIGSVNPIKFAAEILWKNVEKKQIDSGSTKTGIKKISLSILLKSIFECFLKIPYYFYILFKWFSTKLFVYRYRKLSSAPIEGDKYIYYSMHAEPEAALNPMGGWLGNQFVPIKLLSESIPDDWYLYIKMHPAQVDVMLSIDDFKKIKKLKNVKIISDRVSQSFLIKNSMAVATLSGEVGLESNFYNKPCFNLGYTYYSDAPTSFSVHSVGDIKEAIQVISNEIIRCDDNDIKRYLFQVQNMSLKGLNSVIEEIVGIINRE